MSILTPVIPDGRYYWVVDGNNVRPDMVLCECDGILEEEHAALKARCSANLLRRVPGHTILRQWEESRKRTDPEPHWVVIRRGDDPALRSSVYGPATFAECDDYTRTEENDVRGEGYFQIERVLFI